MLYPTLQPGQFQQTLIRSFTLGGIGMQTGEYGERGERHAVWIGVSMQSVASYRPAAHACYHVEHQACMADLLLMVSTACFRFSPLADLCPPFRHAAHVRVRPAFAGEGRYFVRVTPGE